MIVADSTGRGTVTLWESDVGLLQPQKSYQLNQLEVHIYQGKYYLSFPSSPSTDEISDVENIPEPTTSDEDTDDEHLQEVTVSGVKNLEAVYKCISCARNIHPTNTHMGECSACNTTQKHTYPKQTARLIIAQPINLCAEGLYFSAL